MNNLYSAFTRSEGLSPSQFPIHLNELFLPFTWILLSVLCFFVLPFGQISVLVMIMYAYA